MVPVFQGYNKFVKQHFKSIGKVYTVDIEVAILHAITLISAMELKHGFSFTARSV